MGLTLLELGLLFIVAARGRRCRFVSASSVISVFSTAAGLFTITVTAAIAFILSIARWCTEGLGRLVTLDGRCGPWSCKVARLRATQRACERTASAETSSETSSTTES